MYSRMVRRTSARPSTRLLLSGGPRNASSMQNNNGNRNRNSGLKQWPQPVVVSNGDYEEDAFLEDIIGNPLYSEQKNLPPLPVPSIEHTLKKFLSSALPLAESEEEKHNLIQACDAFPREAAKLQERLESRQRDNHGTSSWLQLWWNQAGYLQLRDPVVVNISYFFTLKDDQTLKKYANNNNGNGDGNGNGDDSDSDSDIDNDKPLHVRRGAAILTAIAQYRKKVCSGTLPVERIGKKQIPLCSTAFKYLFHSCRIPKRIQDEYKMFDPYVYKHCIVAVKGQFFAMNFLEDDNDEPLPLASLEAGLEQCIKLADRSDSISDSDSESGDNNHKTIAHLGVLTSSNRDDWADNRERLLRIGGDAMEKALEKLESGCFVLSLDDTDPITLRQLANRYWHGDDTKIVNRWFDKSMHLMCQSNGRLGYMGEHSMADGAPAIGLCQAIVNSTYGSIVETQSQEGSSATLSSAKIPLVSKVFDEEVLDLVTSSDEMMACIEKAQDDFSKLVGNQDISIEIFRKFGSNEIKSIQFSPDSFVQSAIQLATYRLFGKQVGTYEASQVRPFLHGRTETTRSVSEASNAFVQRMGLFPEKNEHDGDVRKEKIALLRTTAFKHQKYLRDASNGQGCDRHFFGLSMLVGENENAPTLFTDPVFQRSKCWRVSTSTLPLLPGFGCVVDDGVGIGYQVGADDIYFAISSRNEHNWTEALGHLLEEALLEMRLLFELEDASGDTPQSKL